MACKYKIIDQIAQTAIEALLFEVSVTPKPGLVDRNNSGAHKDMDFFTFMSSAASLGSHFNEMAQIAYQWTGTLEALFKELREIGKRAENAMFQATEHINTHKGLIFSIGIICGATAYYYKKQDIINSNDILLLCKEMTKSTIDQEFEEIKNREPLTKGENLYMSYGIKGIRGEVSQGFPNVQRTSLPLLKQLLYTEHEWNESCVQILLHLLKEVEDTNILGRHNSQMLQYAQKQAADALKKGGMFTDIGRASIEEMDQNFIERYISPGGCADLLAVTIMMYRLEQL